MAVPRRRLVRPAPLPATPGPQIHQQLLKLRTRLEQERKTLTRWMTRLKRAFHSVEKSQAKLARIERLITKLED
jgi:hypothetical protein